MIFSVIRGVGEMDLHNNYKNRYSTIPPTPKTANSERLNLEYEERPYLIVDLRDRDEFNMNHIVSGIYYKNRASQKSSTKEIIGHLRRFFIKSDKAFNHE